MGEFGLSPPLKLSNQATFSGALMNIFSIPFLFKIFTSLFIFEKEVSPEISLFKT